MLGSHVPAILTPDGLAQMLAKMMFIDEPNVHVY
jgi:hypothetical protein